MLISWYWALDSRRERAMEFIQTFFARRVANKFLRSPLGRAPHQQTQEYFYTTSKLRHFSEEKKREIIDGFMNCVSEILHCSIVAVAYPIARPNSKTMPGINEGIKQPRRAMTEDRYNHQARFRRSTFPGTPPPLAHHAQAVPGDGTSPRDT